MDSILKRLVDESAELRGFLADQAQMSLLRAAEDNARKALVLSAASLFEHRITESLLNYVDNASGSDKCVVSLVRNKAIKRKFHEFFDWPGGKLGAFPTLLGENLGVELKESCARSPGKEQMKAFLEIGDLRNQLVHGNYAVFPLDKTADEIRQLCEWVDRFVEEVELLLSSSQRGTSG